MAPMPHPLKHETLPFARRQVKQKIPVNRKIEACHRLRRETRNTPYRRARRALTPERLRRWLREIFAKMPRFCFVPESGGLDMDRLSDL
jgi:hypothetical protein